MRFQFLISNQYRVMVEILYRNEKLDIAQTSHKLKAQVTTMEFTEKCLEKQGMDHQNGLATRFYRLFQY